MNYVKQFGIYLISLLGALGTALQNYMAVAALIKELMSSTFVLTKAGWGIVHGLALASGGLCSGLVNFCINIGLLEKFFKRFTQKSELEAKTELEGWQRFRYWFGGGVFIMTGILFGLTAFAFGPIGPLAAISVAAGIFVAAIMAIQELETWLESFDPEHNEKKSLLEIIEKWYVSLTLGKLLGNVIAVGNVVALSLLFTLGLATFMTGIGVPALPAVIVGFVVAFTGGAFTEFYFYNWFLSDFCNNLSNKCQQFWQSKYSLLGLIASGINGLVNGVLGYVGITMMTGLLVAAGIGVPPVGVVIAIAATAALFAGLASLILGLDFWQSNSKRLPDLFAQSKPMRDKLLDESTCDTKAILANLPGCTKQQTAASPSFLMIKDISKVPCPFFLCASDKKPVIDEADVSRLNVSL